MVIFTRLTGKTTFVRRNNRGNYFKNSFLRFLSDVTYGNNSFPNSKIIITIDSPLSIN